MLNSVLLHLLDMTHVKVEIIIEFMKRIIVNVLLVIYALPLFSQQSFDSNKLSGYLREIIQSDTSLSVKGKNPKRDEISVLMTVNDQGCFDAIVEDFGCDVLDSIGRIYIVRVPVRRLGEMSLDERIQRIEAHEMPRPLMNQVPVRIGGDKAWRGMNLPQAFTGKNVIAGVIDSEMDFTHPMFLDSLGNTRVRRYIDMSLDSMDKVKDIAHDSMEILNLQHSALAEKNRHGTHVGSIMAGSPVEGKKFNYSGIAPESEIVFVGQESAKSFQFGQKSATTADFLLNFKRTFDFADSIGKPCVINASWGANFSLVDPCVLENEAIKEMTGPGRIIVAGAGNDGSMFTIMEKTESRAEVDARFYTSKSPLLVWLLTDESQSISLEAFPNLNLTFSTDSLDLFTEEEVCKMTMDSLIFVYANRIEDLPGSYPYSKVYQILIYIDSYLNAGALIDEEDPCTPDAMSLFWSFMNRIRLKSEHPCLLCAYPYLCYFRDDEQDYLNAHYSIIWPAESEDVIAVGAINDRTSYYGDVNRLANYSSLGPTWDQRIKPDVVAPGTEINAAANGFYDWIFLFPSDTIYDISGKEHYIISETGTSMACPVVAGAVALWLQAKPDLTPEEIKGVLSRTCKRPSESMDYPNNMYGFGEIDVYAGLLDILGIDGIPDISDHQPERVRFVLNGSMLTVIDTETGNPLGGRARIAVYSTDGRIVAIASGNSVDLSSLNSGIYAVQVNTTNSKTTGSTLIRL